MADDLDSDYLPDELEGSDESSKSENESGYQNVSGISLIEDTDANVSGNKIIFPSTTPMKRKLSKKIMYQCSLCTFQTPLRHKLKRHFIGCKKLKRSQSNHSQVTSGVNFKCEYCFFVTKTLDKLKKHKQSHASLIDLGLIECSHCTFKFFTLDEYKQHMKSTNTLDADNGSNDQMIATPEYVDVSSGTWVDSEGIAIKREVCTDVKDEGDPMSTFKESATNTEKEILSNFNEDLTSNGASSDKDEYRSETARSGKFQSRDLSSYSRHLKITGTTNKKSTESSADNPLVCQICCREAESQLHLVVHVTLDHVKDGAPFSCLKPKCSFETGNRDDMKMHLVNVHKLEENYFSPLSDGNSKQTTEHSLECHLKQLHGMEMDEAHTFIDNNEVQDNHTTLLKCQTCGHKSETEFQMKIHEALKHAPEDGKMLCPVEQCFFATGFNRHLRRHLQRVHKLGENYFKDYGNEHLVKKYKTVKKEETSDNIAEEDVKNALEELSNPVDGEKKARVGSTSSEKKRFECQLCDFSTNHRSSERRHQKYVHTKKRCVLCNKVLRGTFEMVWHKFVIHRDDSDIDFWFLKCDLCDQWGSPMKSYRHGASHEVPKVTFHTEYRRIPTGGYVSFLYSKHRQSKLLVKEEKSDVEYCVAPSAIKVLDWTKSDDEELSGSIDKQETVSIEFIESDEEVESKKVESDSVKAVQDDLVMESELWTCKECNYKTRSESLLNNHKALMHTKWNSPPYPCPQRDCPFKSKYKGNFMRHMKNIHQIRNSSLIAADDTYAGDVKLENVENLAAEHEDLEKHTEVTIIAPGHDSSCESETAVEHQYSKQMHHCPERPNCLFSTPRLSDLLTHYRQSHSILSFCTQKYVCPSLHCLFDTDKKIGLEKHLQYFHKIDENKVSEMEGTILSMKTFKCSKCSFQTRDIKIFKKHYWFKHYTNKGTAKSLKKKRQASCKWSLRCTLCPYETSLKKAAYKHGLLHYYKNPNSKAAFHKCFKNMRRGVLGFSYSSRNRPRNKCRYNGLTAASLIKHKVRHREKNALPRNNPSKTSGDKGTAGKMKRITEIKQHKIKRTSHRLLKEVQAKYPEHSLNDKCIKKRQAENPNTENLEENAITKKGNTKELKEFHSENLKLEGSLEDVDRPIFASETDYFDGNGKQAVFYSTEQLNDIIGVSSKAQQANKGKPDSTDSDWVSALEDEILNEDELSDTESNEVIRIEVTEDDDEENADHISDYSSDEAALDPLTTDFSLENGKRKNPIATRIKCKNEGCDYFCYDTEKIQRHAECCKRYPIDREIESNKEFLCQLCQTTLPDNKSLQSHLVSEHFSNVEGEIVNESDTRKVAKPKPRKRLLAKTHQSTKGISGRTSYQCWMCNELIFYRGTLVNHTYVHAREEDNFKLKVRFTKYIGDTRVDTIVIKADPNYVPRESSNVPLYENDRQKRKRRPKSTTVLDYDPNLTVYGCNECNFKTNLQAALTKHKGLHWTAEKDRAFKAGKWFTCGVCFFHCFDADTLKEHSEKHKSRPCGNINTRRVGLNSWYF